MKKRKLSPSTRSRSKTHLTYSLLALVLGLSCHSCADLPADREKAVGRRLNALVEQVGVALQGRQDGTSISIPERRAPATPGATDSASSFAACRQFFAAGKPPVVALHATDRALCYDAFAILHSGESKTAVYVAEKLNRASIEATGEERTNKFFADARLRSGERATLDDYKGSGFDRGHLAPAGDMPSAQAMAQSFSLANMVPQAPEHNRGAWAKSVEMPTRKYAARATGDVYVITGPVFAPSIAQSPGIGKGQVRVPKYLFKLVYDQDKNRAWAHWHLNDNATSASRPISYGELVRRMGIEFLPGVDLAE